MSIEKQTIENLATLARLAVDNEKVEEISQRLGSVLQLVDQLQAADTCGLSELDHPLNETQRLREDEINKPNMRDAYQAIAPDTEDNLYLVPKVID
ncbi:MAG: Asp-tRNA(Asn)/Glu-tRNA(Gln) amidotransferase subunit GatC [Porticoccaceae bacterium]